MAKKKVVALIGKSGSGKNTLLAQLMKDYPEVFHRKISYTTRTPREGEVDGVDYFFKSEKDFFDLVVGDKMCEVTDIGENFYGTGIDSFKKDKINLGIFDPDGIETLSHDKNIDLLPIYIYATDRVRMIRIFQRDHQSTVEEVYERYKEDRELFDGIETIKNLITIHNNSNSPEFVAEALCIAIKKYFKI